MEVEYFDAASRSELKSFDEKWGVGWECCDFVERRPKEDVERCKEAIESITRSVVAPAFDAKWESYQPHQNLLDNIAVCIKHYQRLNGVTPHCVIEGTSNSSNILDRVRALLNLASRHGESFHNKLKDIVLASNGEYQQGPRKLYSRVLDKAKEDYEGDVSCVVDVERATGIYDSSDDLAKAAEILSNLSNEDRGFTVVRVKESFSKTNWASTSDQHYRDMKFSIRIEGFVGELKLSLRKINHWCQESHHIYSVARVVMNQKPKAAPHCGLASVPVLRFTRDDGVLISDGDCIDDLQKKLERVLPEGCTFSGGYLSNDGIHVYLGVMNIASFAKLRDFIILPNNEFGFALAPFCVDIGAFINLYATNLMKFVKLTSHQEEQLQKIRGADITLLLAPAGGGKTFVAIQCMLEAIRNGDHVLFAARNLPLILFVVQWLVLASGKRAEKVLEKVRVLNDNNDFKFSDGPLRVVVDDKDGRQVLTVKKPIHSVSSFRIAVVDEAHHIIFANTPLQEQLQKLKLQKYLFLGDASQMSMNEELNKESICKFLDLQDSQPIVEARLTEVVRSTKRIVAGASSFQLTAASKAETKTYISSEGLPLVPHLFAPISANQRMKAYAYHVVEALIKMHEDLDNVNLDDRVIIICPDDAFVEELREPLNEELRSQMKDEKYSLVSALDASAALPREPFTNTTDFPRWLVFDSIDRVDGLERLAVIATGLDRSIKETEGDIQTRSVMYRALTRAQLAVAVVNEHVQDGFLEFLTKVKFDDSGAYNENKSKLQMLSTVADEVQGRAAKKASAIEISRGRMSSKKQKRKSVMERMSSVIKLSFKPKQQPAKNQINDNKNKYFNKKRTKPQLFSPSIEADGIQASNPIEILRGKMPNKPNQLVKKAIKKIREMKPIKNTIKPTSQSIWDTRATAERIVNYDLPKFMPFNSDSSLRGFRLPTSIGMILSQAFKRKAIWISVISLNNSQMGDADAIILAEGLKENSLVNRIDLHSNKIGDTGATALAEALKVNMTLTSMDLHSNMIGIAGATALADALRVNMTMTSMDLHSNNIGDAGATALAETLKVNMTMTSMELQYNKIGDAGATALADALKVNVKMRSMDLYSNEIGDVGATALADAIKFNTTMTTMDLHSNKIGDAGATSLADALKVNIAITSMELHCNNIGDVGATALAEAITVNKVMTSMDLQINRISDAGAMALAKALKVNTAMTTMNLQDNKIDEAGATALAEALKVNTTLTNMVLHGDAGAMALAEVLKGNTTMTNIELQYNKIGDAGAMALAEALRVNTTMNSMDLHSNKIGDAGATALAEALKVNSTMTSMDLHFNIIGDAGAMALAEALRVNTTMTSLDLHSNKIGDAGAIALAEALRVNNNGERGFSF